MTIGWSNFAYSHEIVHGEQRYASGAILLTDSIWSGWAVQGGGKVCTTVICYLRKARFQVVVFVFQDFLLHRDCFNKLHWILKLGWHVVCVASRGSCSFLLNSLIVELFIGKSEFFLDSLDLLDQLTLVKCLFCDNLAPQVLDLRSETLLDCSILFSHDLSPDAIELVENLTDASFGHLSAEIVFDLQNCAHSLRRYPIVILSVFCLLGTTLSRPFARSRLFTRLFGASFASSKPYHFERGL